MELREKRTQLIAWLRRAGHRAGWLGLAGAALGLLALAEVLTVARPAAQEAADLEAQVLRMRESPRSRREIGGAGAEDAASQLEAFERFFPPPSEVNRVVAEIHEAAKQEKLALERGEYRLAEEQGLNLLRYQITLPVKGNYASIRGFLRRVLREMPSVSLDGVSLQRQNAGEEAIEAQIRLSAFYRGAR